MWIGENAAFLGCCSKPKDPQTATVWRLVRKFGGNPFSRDSGPAKGTVLVAAIDQFWHVSARRAGSSLARRDAVDDLAIVVDEKARGMPPGL